MCMKRRVNSRWLNWNLRATISDHTEHAWLRIRYIAEYFESVIFHVNYLSYLPVFLCLYCTLNQSPHFSAYMCVAVLAARHMDGRVVSGRGPGDRRLFSSHNGSAVCWTTVPCCLRRLRRQPLTACCVCRDAAAGRHDADGHVPGRRAGAAHDAAALPIAAWSLRGAAR